MEWVFLKIYDFFFAVKDGAATTEFFGTVKTIFGALVTLFGLFFLCVIIYAVTRLRARRREEREKLFARIDAVREERFEEKENKEWRMVLDFITSSNPSDWRLAIIEADNMLDRLTKDLGLVGENLGERLRNASAAHFTTLDQAWEAHKVRNRIAHEGMGYVMEYREVKRAVEQFEAVFKEFKIL